LPALCHRLYAEAPQVVQKCGEGKCVPDVVGKRFHVFLNKEFMFFWI
jgi:hypothetical protein